VLAVLVDETHGAGNPSFPFEVDLGSPLGNRVVLDASVYPPPMYLTDIRPGRTHDQPPPGMPTSGA
jgi:hypothetical protein